MRLAEHGSCTVSGPLECQGDMVLYTLLSATLVFVFLLQLQSLTHSLIAVAVIDKRHASGSSFQSLKKKLCSVFSSFRPGVPFQWTDGTPLDFTNWMQSEPDQLAGPRCVEMYGDPETPLGGLWRVADCHNALRRAICNRPPGELLHFLPISLKASTPVCSTTLTQQQKQQQQQQMTIKNYNNNNINNNTPVEYVSPDHHN